MGRSGLEDPERIAPAGGRHVFPRAALQAKSHPSRHADCPQYQKNVLTRGIAYRSIDK
jgi:hypothetical protein